MSQYVTGNRNVAFERVSEAKILSDLREAARSLGEPLGVWRYRKHAPKRGWVSDFTAANRFGSWAAACTPPASGPIHAWALGQLALRAGRLCAGARALLAAAR